MAGDLGRQGGDPRALGAGALDLSTCVNGYGPAPAGLAALHALEAPTLRGHPYRAAGTLREAYAERLGVPAEELVAGRGTTEFIWALARLGGREVRLPQPSYTDFLRAFPGCEVGDGRATFTAEHLERWMDAPVTVVVSNPLNPSGEAIDGEALAAVGRRHPAALLVVDESYVEFTAEPERFTLVGRDVDNALVLQSPSKFHGIAGARTGVAWTRDADLRASLDRGRGPWPVSGLDVTATVAALGDRAWARATRARLLEDARALDETLRAAPGEVRPGSVTHFRLWEAPHAERVARALDRHGVHVRTLAAAHGFSSPVLRVTAPIRADAERFTDALGRALAEAT